MADDPRDIPPTETAPPSSTGQKIITTKSYETAISLGTHHARKVHQHATALGADLIPAFADRIAFEIQKADDLGPGQLWNKTRAMAITLRSLADSMDDLRGKIDDGATDYSDPDRPNDAFDKLPEWARDMIQGSSNRKQNQ